jgi:PadR family transcriptional regulator, regulatory protein PadR
VQFPQGEFRVVVIRLQLILFFNTIEEMNAHGSLGDLELLVMLAIIRLHPDAYGVLITREIEDKTGRQVMLGSVYAALDRLEARKLVTSELGEATPQRGGRAKRYFRTTTKGLCEVRATRESLVRMWQDVPALEGSLG